MCNVKGSFNDMALSKEQFTNKVLSKEQFQKFIDNTQRVVHGLVTKQNNKKSRSVTS